MNCYDQFLSERNKNIDDDTTFTIACTFGFCSLIYLSGLILNRVLIQVFRSFTVKNESETPTQQIQSPDVNRTSRRNSKSTAANDQLSALWPVRASSASESQSAAISSTESHQTECTLQLSALQTSLHDAIATFQVCSCSLENGIIRSALGVKGLLTAIALHNLTMTQLAYNDSYGSPCNVFYRYLNGRTSITWLLISWFLQLLGAFSALHTSYFWWSFRASSYYTLQLCTKKTVVSTSPSDINMLSKAGDLHVEVPVGMAIEGGAAFVDVMLSLVLVTGLAVWKQRKRHFNVTQNPHMMPYQLPNSFLEEATIFSIRQFTGLYILHLGLPFTGVYINPANAVIQTWGLGQAHPLNHIPVYWLSPMMGIWIAFHFGKILTSSSNRNLLTNSTQVVVIPPALDAGTQLSESEFLRSCASVTVANRYELASVKRMRRATRCSSLTRPLVATGTNWRRLSECRFLSGSRGLGDICRRCPIQNNDFTTHQPQEEGISS